MLQNPLKLCLGKFFAQIINIQFSIVKKSKKCLLLKVLFLVDVIQIID